MGEDRLKKKVVAIVGPTAVGKTDISIKIAKKFDGEIISGDSMQVYRGFDIGTAKIKSEEMKGIPHYMIDIKDPKEPFSVVDFKNEVQKHIDQISSRKKLPLIVGGSGFYIQATLYDYHFSEEERDEAYTKKLEKEMEEKGIKVLYNRLQKIDPNQAEKIHPNNYRRVIRALEIYEKTGKTMTELHEDQPKESPYHYFIIGLNMDRKLLYERINQRVDKMLRDGLEEEVSSLYHRNLKDTQAMNGIGYKEFIPYFEGKQTLSEAVEILKRNTRRYAKRQLTWFKNRLNVHWYMLDPDNLESSFQRILKDLEGFLQKK